MEANHIVKAYDAEITRLNTRISAMGKTCEWQLAKALKALSSLDTRLAQEVVKEDENLNNLYRVLEEDAVKLLAKRTPLAGDLRYMLAAMRAGAELERIGDYAANIACRVTELTGPVPQPPVDLIRDMAKICRRMINESVASFQDLHVKKALAAWHMDTDVDRKFARLLTDLRARMQEDPGTVENCTRLISIGRYLERIGDHVTNIAEDIYYIETGETYIGTLDR